MVARHAGVSVSEIIGNSSFSIDSAQQTFRSPVHCPLRANCEWRLDGKVIDRRDSDAVLTWTLREKYIGNRTLTYVAYRRKVCGTLASLQLDIQPSRSQGRANSVNVLQAVRSTMRMTKMLSESERCFELAFECSFFRYEFSSIVCCNLSRIIGNN